MDNEVDHSKGDKVAAKEAAAANVMSWSDLIILIITSTVGILLGGWFDTHIFATKESYMLEILLGVYGALALYLMHRRDKNLKKNLQLLIPIPGLNVYLVRSLIVAMMIAAGFVLSIFINALFCYLGYCILK